MNWGKTAHGLVMEAEQEMREEKELQKTQSN